MISVLIAHPTSEIIREKEGGKKRKEGLAERRDSMKSVFKDGWITEWNGNQGGFTVDLPPLFYVKSLSSHRLILRGQLFATNSINQHRE